jgi:hypothetical protein
MTTDSAKREPLYIPPEERVSLDELKQRVGQIQDMALTRSKQVVREVYEQDATRIALVAVGVVVVATSLAYLFGVRACRQPDVVDAE